jgi:HlyD family secretion protein
MIKNSATHWQRNPLRWIGLLLAFEPGCDQGQKAGPEPLQGVVEYDDRVIGFELGGRVLEVGVERGQTVAAGAIVARLDDGLERPTRDLRVADLAVAQAQLKLLRAGTRREDLRAAEAEIGALSAQEDTLQKNLARQTQLKAAGAASDSAIDNVTAELRATAERRTALEQRLKALRNGARSEELAAADAHAQAAVAALAMLDARLARYVLASPTAGDVVDVHVKVGEMVAPGAPAVTVADLGHPYVDVFVPEGRMREVAVGARAQARVDGVSEALAARVEHVFPHTEFTPRFLFSESERPNLVLRTRVRVEDPKHVLHAGVPAFVRLLAQGK